MKDRLIATPSQWVIPSRSSRSIYHDEARRIADWIKIVFSLSSCASNISYVQRELELCCSYTEIHKVTFAF